MVENPQLPDPDAKFRPAHADYSEDDSRAVSDGAQDAHVPADAAQADVAADAPQVDAVQSDAVQSPQTDAAPVATQGVGTDSPDDPAHVDTLAQLARGTAHKQSVPAQLVPAQPVPVPPPAPPVPAPQQASGDKNANNTEGVN